MNLFFQDETDQYFLNAKNIGLDEIEIYITHIFGNQADGTACSLSEFLCSNHEQVNLSPEAKLFFDKCLKQKAFL